MVEEKIGKMFIREWEQEESKANIVIIHGVGEHSGRYKHVGEYFFGQGFNVYTGDLVGHGLSDGERVFVKSAEDYFENVNFFLSRIKNDKPIYLLGHSMGGFIVLYYALKASNPKISGIILSSPYVKLKLKVPAWKLAFGKIIAKWMPKTRLQNGIKADMVCRDPNVCKTYGVDNLNCRTVTAGWFVALENGRHEMMQQANKIQCPCLMLQSGNDVIVDGAATREFFESIGSLDKEFVMYNDFNHEMLNDPEKEKPLSKINQWICDRLS